MCVTIDKGIMVAQLLSSTLHVYTKGWDFGLPQAAILPFLEDPFVVDTLASKFFSIDIYLGLLE